MKAAGGSAAGVVLAGGQFSVAEIYTFALAPPAAVTLRFTNWDVPLTVSGNTYLANLLIQRGTVSQRAGVEVQTLALDLAPQSDGDAITIGGLPFLQACRLGFLDSCRIAMAKLFMATPGDVSAGAVPWFQGRVRGVTAGRVATHLEVESDLALLNIAMPRNVIQTGCTHRVFDPGCTLNPASYVVSGTVATVSTDRTSITTDLTQANDYFALGVLTFTSGVLSGIARSVKRYLNASGEVVFMQQLPLAPAASDTFTILPGCDKRQATCSSKFSNLAHFRGYPYVPVPETIYAGGTLKSADPSHLGRQGKHQTAGNPANGRRRLPGP